MFDYTDKKILIFCLLLTATALAISCATSTDSTKNNAVAAECNPYFDERIRAYFDSYEVKADQILNSGYETGQIKSQTKTIKIGRHVIEWIDPDQGVSSGSRIRINGDLIMLKDNQSVNAADGNAKIDIHLVDEWRQIKLYKLLNQELIAVAMGPKTCTGLMCGVGAQLWYDVKSQKKTFFGTYRTDFDVRLFRFTSEESYQIVSTNFEGDPHGVISPEIVTYELYGLQPDGQFQIQKTTAGDKYFIKHTRFPDSEIEDNQDRKRKEIKLDSLQHNWITKLWQ